MASEFTVTHSECGKADAGSRVPIKLVFRWIPVRHDEESLAFHQPRHFVEQLPGEEADPADALRERSSGLAMEVDSPQGGRQRIGAAGGEAAHDPGERVARAGGGEADPAAGEAEGAAVGGDDEAILTLDQGDRSERLRGATGGGERV